MNSQKQHRNDKLQKSSVLFLQLGLVLALFVTFITLEFESVKKSFPVAEVDTSDPIPFFDTDVIVEIQRETKPIEKKIQPRSLEKIKKVPDHIPTPVEIFKSTEVDPKTSIDDLIGKLPGGDTDPIEPVEDDIIFEKIEEAPIFPGCENLDQKALKQCFTDKISKFVNRKFNTDIAENLSGKQRIWVEFVVDKTGTVTDIRARSPYKNLEKEAIRVVEKLPQMTPGKQRTRAVNVKYTLPIVFQTY